MPKGNNPNAPNNLPGQKVEIIEGAKGTVTLIDVIRRIVEALGSTEVALGCVIVRPQDESFLPYPTSDPSQPFDPITNPGGVI